MKRNKQILFGALLVLMALALCACSDNWEAPYASLNEEGFNVSVRFDVNGGVFAGTSDVYVVDVFNTANGVAADDGQVGFYLLSPDDPIRAEGCFTVSRNGYFLAGWYTERTPRVDENGQPLDEYGVPTAESGREQGYMYSGRWDFSSDLLTVDPSLEYNSEDAVQTLYAAWIPYIPYEIYSVDTQSGQTELRGTIETVTLELPSWDEKTGKLNLRSFPEWDGYTLDMIYLDASLTTEMTESINGSEQYVDYETGTLNVDSVAIYTTWMEGNWFKIYTAEQFCANSRLDGNYMICADLDFSNCIWSPTLVKGKFAGKIQGNGYTFSNITATQGDAAQVLGGLFGALESTAVIEDLTLENVSVTIAAGSRMQGASFGLLCGSASSDAVLSNLTVNGTLYISENCYPQSDYTIGLLCGTGNPGDVTYTIDCRSAEDNTDRISIAVDGDAVYVTFNP